jgi:hypothetical protein
MIWHFSIRLFTSRCDNWLKIHKVKMEHNCCNRWSLILCKFLLLPLRPLSPFNGHHNTMAIVGGDWWENHIHINNACYHFLRSIDLVPEEGGGSVELVNNGRDIIVNEQNVYDYVRKYAEYRMIKTQEKALEAIRSGVFDVLPETALDSLTAEDLRLLLNGVGDINVSVLSNYTSFNDESNESAEKLQRFKRWLWQIVERMTNLERQDLVKNTRHLSHEPVFLSSSHHRSTSGRDRQHCLHPKRVSSPCQPSLFAPLMTLTCQPPTHAFHASTYRCTLAKPSCATSC